MNEYGILFETALERWKI